jgi:hypothetical protein
MICYRVNNQTFNNVYLAHYESYKSGKPVSLYCFDHEYDQLDWTKEPELSFQDLMSAHALHLREKYERLIFMWSGGTDSHTIYNVFKRNNIHIDEIIIKYFTDSENYPQYPESHVNWIKANHYDPTTEITAWNEYDTNLRSLFISNEDWIFNNVGDLYKFGQSTICSSTVEMVERKHNGHNWGIVVGVEKPHVLFENGNYYSFSYDRELRSLMGYHDHYEFFYLNPIIHLKQSHLAKRALKKLKNHGDSREWGRMHNGNRISGPLAYRAWSRSIGLDDELTIGSSYMQKKFNVRLNKIQLRPETSIEEFDLVNGDPVLLAQLKNQNPTAINYVKGLYNLRSDRGFYRFLNEQCLIEPDKVLNPKLIVSKPYNLGE